MRRNKRLVATALTASMATAWLAGCSSSDDGFDTVKACKDPVTGKRVDDSECDDGSGGHGGGHATGHAAPYWYYMPIRSGGSVRVPAVGQPLPAGGSRTASSGARVTTVGAKGGSVSHGGFGHGGHGGKGS